MELPRRNRGDELLRPGELTRLRARLRRIAGRHDLATVIACAFDHRTRMLPFIFADTHMAPAGGRAIGSAPAGSRVGKTRTVLQQWDKRVFPAPNRLGGRRAGPFPGAGGSGWVAGGTGGYGHPAPRGRPRRAS